MNNYYELIHQSLIDGLKEANYDVPRFQPAYIRAGIFADRTEIMTANSATIHIAQVLKMRVVKNGAMPREELEKAVELLAAESTYRNAESAIQIYNVTGENASKYVQQARDAIKILERHPNSSVGYYKRNLKELIGEE